jgi:hypothetical protein
MASDSRRPGATDEYCTACEKPQPTRVSISILTENPSGKNAAFSREPYRIVECRVCGETTRTRMNDA